MNSKFRGVTRRQEKDAHSSLWMAQIRMHGTTYNLGYYLSEEEAAKAYDEALLLLCDYKKTNYGFKEALARLVGGTPAIRNTKFLERFTW